MSALLYLMRTMIRNWLLQLRKKPALIVVYVLFFALLLFTLIPTGGQNREGSLLGGEAYFRTLLFVLFLFLTYLTVSKGLKQGSTFFSMPDVNMLFTSPIRPQSVLLYGIIRQMGTSALATLFLFFQIPNLRNFFGLDASGIAGVLLAWFLLLVSLQAISLSVYSLTAPHPARRKIGKYILYGIIAIVAVAFFAHLLLTGADLSRITAFFDSPLLNFVPLAGWMTAFATGIASGDIPTALLFLCLTLFFSSLGIALVRRTDSDYYEDVLQTTEISFTLRQAMKSGRATTKTTQARVKAGKSGLVGSGVGASTFFYRHLTEQRRTGFMILDKLSILTVAAALAGGLIFRRLIATGDLSPVVCSYIGLGALSYLLYFLTITGKFTAELSKPYIYLIPEKETAKLFYSNLASVVKALIEGVLSFGILAFFCDLPIWYVPLAALLYASLCQLYISVSILTQRILGESRSKLLTSLLYLLCAGFLIVPCAILFAVPAAILSAMAPSLLFLAYVAPLLYNVIVSVLVLFLCRGVLQTADL